MHIPIGHEITKKDVDFKEGKGWIRVGLKVRLRNHLYMYSGGGGRGDRERERGRERRGGERYMARQSGPAPLVHAPTSSRATRPL